LKAPDKNNLTREESCSPGKPSKGEKSAGSVILGGKKKEEKGEEEK